MPKTFTDDTGPALPAALDGPFQIVDPISADSYFKIDPAAGRIEAAGGARPVRRIVLGYGRAYGLTTAAPLGTALVTRAVGANANAGFYTQPCLVPVDMDVGLPSRVKMIVAPGSDVVEAAVVRLEAVASFAGDGATSVANLTTSYDWLTPRGWPTEDLRLTTIDNGTGCTFAADTFGAADVFGLRIARLGSVVQDTFPTSLITALAVVFEYTAKQI